MSNTYVDVTRVDGQGMITVRADLSDAGVQTAIKAATGVDMPAQTSAIIDGQNGLAWMSLDELLVLCPEDDRGTRVAGLVDALSSQHALVVDVSDARSVFTLKGPSVREVLAKLTPTDTHTDALPQNAMRRTRFGQVAGAFWFVDAETVQIVCFRSVGDYMHRMLEQSARVGSEVAI